jgi:hypothetical protein
VEETMALYMKENGKITCRWRTDLEFDTWDEAYHWLAFEGMRENA